MLAVRLQPGASRNQIDGLELAADGSCVLKARVTAPPEAGKANAALIKLLAKSWRIPKSDLSLVSGHHNRRKLLSIAGNPSRLQPRIEAWLKSLPGPV